MTKRQHNMDYTLQTTDVKNKGTLSSAGSVLGPYLRDEKRNLTIAISAMLISSAANLATPFMIAYIIDNAVSQHDYKGIFWGSAILVVVYCFGLIASYTQTIRMGTVGRGLLFKLRNALFLKLSDLPVAFFNANKAGDLISRINNDTDKLYQFFGQTLMQFIGNFFVIIGAGVVLLSFNLKLGLWALLPAFLVLIITQILGVWVKRKNKEGLQSLGSLSAEIQESLANFKVVVAFNRVDYFRNKFSEVNTSNYKASVGAGIASNIFTPLYTVAANVAQLLVLAFGITMVQSGEMTIGLLIAYFLYVTSFYNPLRQLANVWSSFQLALASLDRIQEVLGLESNLPILEKTVLARSNALLSFDAVSFAYSTGKEILHNITLDLEVGKTYALVGPTGGGKTTTASLMARLFDPTSGVIYLHGQDIRSYSPSERAQKIGFILQEPFLFTGTVGENILYGNTELRKLSENDLLALLKERQLLPLLERFKEGLTTNVTLGGASISLGQKQLIAFMRAVLRNPELLILDEATANIDTVTEQLLETLLAQLPKTTTKVIIAHRLNTIENADDIFFVNSGMVTEAGGVEQAVEMLMSGKRGS